MAYQGALHPDGTPIQGMPDGMQGRTMTWDSPADMLGPDGERPCAARLALALRATLLLHPGVLHPDTVWYPGPASLCRRHRPAKVVQGMQTWVSVSVGWTLCI